jgi:hypothetical protein
MVDLNPPLQTVGSKKMAKKAAVVKKIEVTPSAEKAQVLVEAIIAVRNLDSFIKDRGGLEGALSTVSRVGDLVALTGGFEQLKTALEIVGRESAPASA